MNNLPLPPLRLLIKMHKPYEMNSIPCKALGFQMVLQYLDQEGKWLDVPLEFES